MDSDIITAGTQHYRVAGWLPRVVARVLDIFFIVGVCAVGGEYLKRAVSKEMAVACVLLVSALYLLIGNGLMKGATLGKRLVGLKVIEARHGGPCGVLKDFLRQRHIFSGNPISMVITFYDSVTERLLEQETHVVHATPLKEAGREVPPEIPAKLNLDGMGETLRKMREARDAAGPREK